MQDFVAESSKPLQGNSVVWRGRGVAGCRREEVKGEGEVKIML